MRFSHVIALLMVLVLAIATPIIIDSDFNSAASRNTSQYTSYLKSATKAGMSAALSHSDDNGNVFGSDMARNEAVTAYYNVLMKCFNYEFTTSQDLVKYYTPCIFLVDNDGYYIEYTETYKSDGYDTYTDVITPINKWSAKYGTYYVEFHLDDTVRVVYNNTIHEGRYDDVFKKLGEPSALHTGDSSPSPELPNFAASREVFTQVKEEYIVGIIQEKLEYYINTHQEFFNQKGNVQYAFTLPRVKGEDWGRLLDMPTIIGFLQGVQVPHSDEFINVYAFTGNEMTATKKYYVLYDETYELNYYHTGEHAESLGVDTSKQLGYSMEGAAKSGAHPCPDCILHRH